MVDMVFKLPWRIFFLAFSLPNLKRPLFRFSTSLSFASKPFPVINKQFIKQCRNSEDLKLVKSVLVVSGLVEDEVLIGEFVKSCFRFGVPDVAISVVRGIGKPSMVLQNLMIRYLSDYGLYEGILCVYRKCRVSGCLSDDFTFPYVIKACSALGDFRLGKEVHCVVLRSGFEVNVVIQTALVDFYAKSGCMDSARILFDKITEPDLVCWNALIAGYSLNGFYHDAFEVFKNIHLMGLKPNSSTFASIIPICTHVKCVYIGQSLHCFIVKSGYFSNSFLIPALISMYAAYFNLCAARKLFENIPEKNISIWNATISAYTRNQNSFEAFNVFRLMLRASMQPNLITFVSVIPSFENSLSIWSGESVHALSIKQGLNIHLPVLTAVASMYCKLGDMNSAEFLFDQMSARNLLSWNLMVSGYLHNGFCDACLTAFSEMQFAGFKPDTVSIICILSACSEKMALLPGKSAHAFSIRNGIDSIVNVSNAILAFYADFHNLTSSFKVFHNMETRNTVSWNTLISGCVHIGLVSKAVALLHQMQKESMKLDLVTLISILPCYNESENLGQGMAVHCYAMKSGFCLDISLVNALISMYCGCEDLNAGRLLFEAMPERSVVSWNALITGYRCHNLKNEVLVLFGQMIKEDINPNYVSIINLLPLCSSQLQGKSIHAYALRKGIVLEPPLLTSLIAMYTRFENLELCLLLFKMGEKSDISLWNAVMSAHVKIKKARQVVRFFRELLQMRLEPDNITVLSLISACVQITSLNLSHSVMGYVIRNGFEKDVVICNALIDLYAKCGNILFAKKLFEELTEKDIVSWNAMINGYGLHGDAEAALHLFSQMQLSGMRPDGAIYLTTLSACSHAGLVEQGWMVLKSMVENRISRGMEQYGCIVDLLGRRGYLNEAYDIVKKLPGKPSISLLESLLGACKLHGNVELGEKISGMVLEIDPEHQGSYVILRNIYAAAGRWTDANRVRSEMEGRKLKKVAGFSLLTGNDHHDEGLS